MQPRSPTTLIAMLAALCLAGFATNANEEPVAPAEPSANAEASDASASDATSVETASDATSAEDASDAASPEVAEIEFAVEDPLQPDQQ